MKFETLSYERKTSWTTSSKMCAQHFGEDVTKLNNFQVNNAIWNMFNNDCMLAVVCLCEEK